MSESSFWSVESTDHHVQFTQADFDVIATIVCDSCVSPVTLEKRDRITDLRVAGQIDIAAPSQVHGAINEGTEDAVFVSIYSAPSLKVLAASP